MPISYTQELSCKMCGKTFVFRNYEKELFEQRGYANPKHCTLCRKTTQELREKEIERIENEKWQEKKSEDKKAFNVRLNGCILRRPAATDAFTSGRSAVANGR